MTTDAEKKNPATEPGAERHDGPLLEGPTPQPSDVRPERRAPEDLDEHVGAEGGSSSAQTPTPFHPHEDDNSPLGDTDQHSKA